MLIDWFTVGAQIVNFLILVALLRYFLYRPITRAMDEREHNFASRLEMAEQARAKAAQEAELHHRKNIEFDAQQQERLAQARREVEQRRGELTQQARADVEAMRLRWEELLNQEKETFLSRFRLLAAQQTCELARDALRDLADVDLEKQVFDAFLRRLKSLAPDAKIMLQNELAQAGGELLLTSTMPLAEPRRAALRTLLWEEFQSHQEPQFTIAPALVCGVELRVRGHKLAWSVEDYVQALEGRLVESLETEMSATHRAQTP
ncbi:MAG: hypothetical protein ACREJ2_00965 [Planctomycetota bacterium]